MSRFRLAIHGVASGYVMLAATAVFSLASVPVALHYLSKERFGLWALMCTMVGYLNLVDMGMSGSVSRLLIDVKDDRDGGHYGSLIKTGWLVLVTQGLIVFAAGLVFAGLFARLMAIPANLQPDFIRLMNLQCGVVALGYATRIFSHLLTAHQRMDLVNYAGTLAPAVNLAALWVFFHLGFGVISLVWAALCSTLTNAAIQWIACGIWRFFPKRGGWGTSSWSQFKDIFNYGRDLFLVSVGTQVILTSQTMIITRLMGLENATAWNVATRTFNLLLQAIGRVVLSPLSAFSEMMVRGEQARLRERYRSLVILVASLCVFGGVSFAMCNSLFVKVWTSGRIIWPPLNDLLLGAWLVVLFVQACHSNLILTTKKIGFMRYVFFIEGAVYVVLAVLTVPGGGLPALIACSVFCSATFTGMYGAWRISCYFGCPFGEVAFRWMKHAGIVLLGFAPPALLCWWGTGGLGALPRLAILGALAATLGLFVLLRFGVPPELQAEFQARAPAKAGRLLAKIFGQLPVVVS
jgi:O-antigen/teichoic acid export membrane protein